MEGCTGLKPPKLLKTASILSHQVTPITSYVLRFIDHVANPGNHLLSRTFKAFSYRDFRLMWIGACTSSIGGWMQIVAQSWLVYTLSGDDPFYLGLDAFLGQAPIVLFSLFGGVIADRQSRRQMLLISQYIQMTRA